MNASLASELRLGEVDHDALVTVLTTFFPSGEWQSGNEVPYRTAADEVGLTLIYDREGLRDVRRGPALTDDAFTDLQERVALLTAEAETVVSRDVFFNVRRVTGYWRYEEEWQITPVPPQAPRVEWEHADHPFVVEIRMPVYPTQIGLTAMTRDRRLWEVQLILNLVVNGPVTRIGPRDTANRSWMYVDVADGGGVSARYLQHGYTIPGWSYQGESFSSRKGLDAIAEIPDTEYSGRRGVGPGEVFELPDVLRPLLDHYHATAPETRDRFLRACYWYERSGAAWSLSVSLGHIAAVNAIETLMPAGDVDPCPTCNLNRAPGVTRRFRDFVERYASTVDEGERAKIYNLRSALVHEGHPLDIDVPGPWGALVPRDWEQRDLYGSARAAAREAIVHWFFDQ